MSVLIKNMAKLPMSLVKPELIVKEVRNVYSVEVNGVVLERSENSNVVRTYEYRFGPTRIKRAKLFVAKDNKEIGEIEVEEGIATLKIATPGRYVVSNVPPRMLHLVGPLASYDSFSVDEESKSLEVEMSGFEDYIITEGTMPRRPVTTRVPVTILANGVEVASVYGEWFTKPVFVVLRKVRKMLPFKLQAKIFVPYQPKPPDEAVYEIVWTFYVDGRKIERRNWRKYDPARCSEIIDEVEVELPHVPGVIEMRVRVLEQLQGFAREIRTSVRQYWIRLFSSGEDVLRDVVGEVKKARIKGSSKYVNYVDPDQVVEKRVSWTVWYAVSVTVAPAGYVHEYVNGKLLRHARDDNIMGRGSAFGTALPLTARWIVNHERMITEIGETIEGYEAAYHSFGWGPIQVSINARALRCSDTSRRKVTIVLTPTSSISKWFPNAFGKKEIELRL